MESTSKTGMENFTSEGLPADQARPDDGLKTTEIGDGGSTARRIALSGNSSQSTHFSLAKQAVASVKAPGHGGSELQDEPSSSLVRDGLDLVLAKAPLCASSRLPLRVGPTHLSLIDDDDEEFWDPFSDSQTKQSASSSSLAMTTMDLSEPSGDEWRVLDEYVPTLPSFYPLDNSATFIPQSSASAIAELISAVLRSRSISAVYHSKPCVKADCSTKTNVDFRVHLYRGRGEFQHGIIVEVQRRDGFDFSYMKDVYAILDAAEGKHPDPQLDETPSSFEEENLGKQEAVMCH